MNKEFTRGELRILSGHSVGVVKGYKFKYNHAENSYDESTYSEWGWSVCEDETTGKCYRIEIHYNGSCHTDWSYYATNTIMRPIMIEIWEEA